MHAGLTWAEDQHSGNLAGRTQAGVTHAVYDDRVDAFTFSPYDFKQRARDRNRRLELAFDRAGPCGYFGMGEADARIFQCLEIPQLAKASRDNWGHDTNMDDIVRHSPIPPSGAATARLCAVKLKP
ncbi:hypothetical protein D3C78_895950 [compost metagenome]